MPVSRNSGALYLDEVSIFFDLFNPGNGHRTEELRRLENTREEEAQGEPGRGPIDLNSGTVRIRVPAKEPAAEGDGTEDVGTEHVGAVDDGAAAPAEEDGGA
jgi:hypothetical protein